MPAMLAGSMVRPAGASSTAARSVAGASKKWALRLAAVLAAWYLAAVIAGSTGVLRGAPGRLPTVGFVVVATTLLSIVVLRALSAVPPPSAIPLCIAMQVLRI